MPNPKPVTVELKGKNGQLIGTLKSTNKSLGNLRKNTNSSTKSLDKAGQSAEGFGRQIRAAQGYAAAFIGVAGLRGLISYADQYTNLQNKIKLVTDSEQQAIVVQNQLFDIAQKTRVSLDASATLYSRLALGSDDLAFSQTQLLRVTETLNKQVLIGGNNAAEASAGLVQFAQGIASGRLQGDELRSVMENLLGVQKGLIKGFQNLQREGVIDFEVTKSNIRDLASTGVLSSELLLKALLSVSDETDELFGQLEVTVAQSVGILSNSFLQYIGEANNASGATQALSAGITGLAGNLPLIIGAVTQAAVVYGGLKAATLGYSLVQAGLVTSTVASTKGIVGLGGSVVTTTSRIKALTLASKALSRTLPFLAIYATIEAYDSLFNSGEKLVQSTDALIESNKALGGGLKNNIEYTQEEVKVIEDKIKAVEELTRINLERKLSETQASIAELKFVINPDTAGMGRTISGLKDLQKVINFISQSPLDLQESTANLSILRAQAIELQKELDSLADKKIDVEIAGLDFDLAQINRDADALLSELNTEIRIEASTTGLESLDKAENALKDSFDRRADDALAFFNYNQELFNIDSEKYVEALLRNEAIYKETSANIEQDRQAKHAKNLQRIQAEADAQLASATDWQSGVLRATKSYYDSAQDSATQYEQLTTNAFQNMEDAIVQFSTTGKLSFKEFARSVIADLIRIYVKQQLVGALAGAFGGTSTSTLFSQGVAAGGTQVASSAGLTTPGFANGGIMSSNGAVPLNKYASGGIATSPQLALFGEGRKPEAYVPLPDGRTIPVTLEGQKSQPSITNEGDTVINVTYAPNLSSIDPSTAHNVIAENAPQITDIIRQAMNRTGKEAAF